MISDEEYSNLLEKYNFEYKEGSVIKGTVIGYEKDALIIDIKDKTFALCPFREILYSDINEIKQLFELNKEYEFIITDKDEEEQYHLSHKKIAVVKNSNILIEKYKNNEAITAVVTNITKGGIIVNAMGIKGFVPLSQLKTEVKINDEIELKVLSYDNSRSGFIFSNKQVYLESIEEIKKEIFDKIELNMVVKGTITRLVDFGAFVDIGGVEGLLPLSQISYKWIDKPQDMLTQGQKLDVEIIGIDKEKQRISLSLKTLGENPWLKAQDFLQDKKTLKGKVTSIKPFGAFIEVYPDVEGLLGKKELQEYCSKYNKEISLNDDIEVEIVRFDAQNQKIALKIV